MRFIRFKEASPVLGTSDSRQYCLPDILFNNSGSNKRQENGKMYSQNKSAREPIFNFLSSLFVCCGHSMEEEEQGRILILLIDGKIGIVPVSRLPINQIWRKILWFHFLGYQEERAIFLPSVRLHPVSLDFLKGAITKGRLERILLKY
jgi:hypothetical protein